MLVACSDSPSEKSETPADANSSTCKVSEVTNDPACPSEYVGHKGKPCSPAGLGCSYPGQGDDVQGCPATAVLVCQINEAGVLDTDGGVAEAVWLGMQ